MRLPETRAAQLAARVQEARDTYTDAVSAQADLLVSAWVREWRRAYPRSRVRMIFGNGSEYIEINGLQVPAMHRSYPRIERQIEWLQVALGNMTNGYLDGIPSDVRSEP